MKILTFTAVAAALLLTWTSSRADTKDECIDAHERAQQLRNAGHLKAAKKELLVCSRNDCPSLVLADCRPWINATREEEPSIVFSVHDEHGIETSEVRVLIDGEALVERLDGQPIDVDPGQHVLRFERPNFAPLEQRLFLRVGEQKRLVSVAFPSAHEDQMLGPRRSRWSPGAVVSGVVAVAGLGAFAGFGISGKIEEGHLSGTCKPNCAAAQIADVRTQYIVAYTSLAVGAVALGFTIGLLAMPPTRRASAIQWGVAPFVGGAAATVVGRF